MELLGRWPLPCRSYAGTRGGSGTPSTWGACWPTWWYGGLGKDPSWVLMMPVFSVHGFRTTVVAAHIDRRHRFNSTSQLLESRVSLSTSSNRPVLLYVQDWTALMSRRADCRLACSRPRATPCLDVVIHAGVELELLHEVGDFVDQHLPACFAQQLRIVQDLCYI